MSVDVNKERAKKRKKWAELDSNQRRRKPADLQSAPVGHLGICPFSLKNLNAHSPIPQFSLDQTINIQKEAKTLSELLFFRIQFK